MRVQTRRDRRMWTEEQLETLRRELPLGTTESVRDSFFPNKSLSAIACKACQLGVSTRSQLRRKHNLELAPSGLQQCIVCGVDKPLAAFYASSTDHTCIECRKSDRCRSVRAALKGTRAAKALGLDFLENLWLAQRGICAYTGKLMSYGKIHDPARVSVDRVDSLKGYAENNVVLCCFRVNRAKMEVSVPEFVAMCREVVSHADKS